MPKKPNAKKMAAVMHGTAKALEEAVKGEHLVAKVEKALGNCAFSAIVELPNGSTMATQVLVRGKYKGGGKNGPSRVEVGCYVLVEGDPTKAKVLEVVGVVNRHSGLERLKRAARAEALTAEAEDIDDLFDRSDEEAQKADIWADAMKNREALVREAYAAKRAEAMATRYGTKAAGEREMAPELGSALEAAEDSGFDLFAAAETKAPRRLRKAPAATAPAAAAPTAAPSEEELADADLEAALDTFTQRAVPATWEDEVDIDAI
jgi:hypothetical protein